MIHVMEGEWSILDQTTYVDCSRLYALINYRETAPIDVPLEEISHKPLPDVHSTRYKQADLSLPILLCPGMKNPHNKPYRMLDGRHRFLKALQGNLYTIPAYLVLEQDVLRFLRT